MSNSEPLRDHTAWSRDFDGLVGRVFVWGPEAVAAEIAARAPESEEPPFPLGESGARL